MNDKLFPILLIIGGLVYAFKDKVELPDLSPNTPSVVVVESREFPEALKSEVSGLISIVKSANLDKDLKRVLSNLWAANGDVWKNADVNINSNKIEDFNKDLLKTFSIEYPQIVGSVPGFSAEVNKLYSSYVSEYPTPVTKEEAKKISELSYAISWSFTQ